MPSNVNTLPNLTRQDLIRKWEKMHEENLRKDKEQIQVGKEKTKKRLDEEIVRKHPIYQIGDLVKILDNTKRNKLKQYWKGLYEVIDYTDNNNLRIRNKDKGPTLISVCFTFHMKYLATMLLALASSCEANYTITPLKGNIYIEDQAKVGNLETDNRKPEKKEV